jgi:cellulose synthase/poly-beta-1,6-N-acetylglucosamine synthase-like glycosyltransferase
VEVTAFVWPPATQVGASYGLAETVCTNQAPPSFGEIFEQRRRWAAGNHREASRLPMKYRPLAKVRNYAWALSPVVTVAATPLSLLHPQVAFEPAFQAISVALVAMPGFWFLRGLAEYGRTKLGYLLALQLLPVVSVVHSAGTVAGILRPPESFRVVKKVRGGRSRSGRRLLRL